MFIAVRPCAVALSLVCFFEVLHVSGICAEPDRPREREFTFRYGATVEGVPEGAKVRLWLPVPPTSESQEVVEWKRQLPAPARQMVDSTYGNQILYLELAGPADGQVPLRVEYRIRRKEVRGLRDLHEAETQPPLSPREKRLFLGPNAMVPTSGKPLLLLQNVALPKQPLAVAKSLYDKVDDHVRYDKSRPGYGNGDVLWVCDSRCGNCTDFHSLFISLARSKSIPARFEIGFPLPPERGQGKIGGYHCWASFFVDGRGWIPVDISEADKHPELKSYYFGNLTENRVTFSQGRDLMLEPKQATGPLNFFVYPHVEVDGKRWPKEKVELDFQFDDRRQESAPQ